MTHMCLLDRTHRGKTSDGNANNDSTQMERHIADKDDYSQLYQDEPETYLLRTWAKSTKGT